MSFFKKIGKFIKKNVNLRNVVNVTKYAANLIPGVGGIVSTGIAAAQGAYDEQQARKEQERMEREAINQVNAVNAYMSSSKPDMSARSSASLTVSNQDFKDIEQLKNNNNKNNNKDMSFLDKLENKTFKGARYVLFAIPVLLLLFRRNVPKHKKILGIF